MEPLFDHEKLDVYGGELAFIAWIADFLGDVAKRLVSVDRVQPGKEMLARVVAMLTRLIDLFDTDDSRNRGS